MEFIKNDEGEYIEDYGGRYLDSREILHLQFVEGTAERYQKFVENNADVVIEECKFSFCDLMNIKSEITNVFMGQEHISSVGIRESTNSVNVESDSTEMLEKIKEYLEKQVSIYRSGMVDFILTDNKYTLASIRLEENTQGNTEEQKNEIVFLLIFFLFAIYFLIRLQFKKKL